MSYELYPRVVNSFFLWYRSCVTGHKFSRLSFTHRKLQDSHYCYSKGYKNSSGDDIANVNFYALRPEATRIR